MATAQKFVSLQLLVSGFLRKQEKQLNLSMNIPDGIDQIIHKYHPLLLFKFGDCNENAFGKAVNGTVIQGTGLDCHGYLVYADLGQFSNDGLNQV